jgi:hypothetical protein
MTQMSGSVSLDMRRLVETVRTTVRDELAYPVLLTPEDATRVLWDHADAGTMSQEQAQCLAERLKADGYAITAVRTDLRDWYADRYAEVEPVPLDGTRSETTTTINGVPGVNLDAIHAEGQAAARMSQP